MRLADPELLRSEACIEGRRSRVGLLGSQETKYTLIGGLGA